MSKKQTKLNEVGFDTVQQYTNDASMLRQSIVEELNAINIYKAMADKARHEKVREVMNYVIEEEKKHIGEFQAILRQIDSEYEGLIKDGEEEVEEREGEDYEEEMEDDVEMPYDLTENDIRILAFHKVKEDENFCCPHVKKQLLNYFKECDIHDVKAYLLDGDIDIVEEDAKDIIDRRFNNSNIKHEVHLLKEQRQILNEADPVTALGLTVLGIWLGPPIIKAIAKSFTKCLKKCDNIRDTDRKNLCMAKCRVEHFQEKLKKLQSVDCSKQKNPDKCKKKLEKEIKKTKEKIETNKEKVKNYSQSAD